MDNLNSECKITSTGDYNYIGGIIGTADNIEIFSMNACNNNGTMTIVGAINGFGTYHGGSFIGGLVGYIANRNTGKVASVVSIENCKNTGDINSSGGMQTAGICGYISKIEKVKIENIENSGVINSGVESSKNVSKEGGSFIGGAFGYVIDCPYICIKDVTNNGTLKNYENSLNSSMRGGIIGYICRSNTYIYNTVCTEKANIQGTNEVGGIIGYADNCQVVIEKSNNKAMVSGDSYVGGIIGQQAVNSIWIIDSFNSGYVAGDSSSGSYSGGLIGYSGDTANVFIKNSYNTGYIYGTKYIGGLVGYLYNKGNKILEYSYNTGHIKGDKDSSWGYSCTGGLIGMSEGNPSKIYNCYNSGSIDTSSTEATGGIIGRNRVSSTIENCKNMGLILVTYNSGYSADIGGIIGEDSGSSSIKKCINYGEITIISPNTEVYVGGISGYSGVMDNCSNEGEIQIQNATKYCRVGGISGNRATITNCNNSGKITANSFRS